ncbi:MAG: hypothetical protein A2908_03265 [Candidatus Staskawiczbacteria bacterium RIFCSPLOWO2_01_FULL_38_12b]|uniref:Prepilin-type N-terminal cleavage/methylation domain-containing protein n=1 Tax=Candidatus Staskawiczbacteria bacterium RIFCSPLOWO2_01_FULL_38_12b TaxID=1802214 RepID=A0A1G2IE34_9BACT|nr:MAG: hypothetical protein A2908_03265 [Candidatus Staskawiczbacteria bacterium RIFCSPLOWO2_01_FULL_38_12b]
MEHITHNKKTGEKEGQKKCFMFDVPCSMNRGFTLLEILVYISILSLVLLLTSTAIFYFSQSNKQTKGDREVLENARRAMEIITYEINGAKSIYTPTSSPNQISLETSKYLPANETTTYIDFFLCGTRICLKKEAQDPFFLTSDSVEVTTLEFTQVSTNGNESIKIALTMNYQDSINNIFPSISITSTASLRSY